VVRPVFQPAGLPGGLLPGPAPLPVAALGAGTPAE